MRRYRTTANTKQAVGGVLEGKSAEPARGDAGDPEGPANERRGQEGTVAREQLKRHVAARQDRHVRHAQVRPRGDGRETSRPTRPAEEEATRTVDRERRGKRLESHPPKKREEGSDTFPEAPRGGTRRSRGTPCVAQRSGDEQKKQSEKAELKQTDPSRGAGNQAEPERTKRPPRVAAEHGAPRQEPSKRTRPRAEARDREGHLKPTQQRSATAEMRTRSPRAQGRKAPRGGAETRTRLPMYATPSRDTKGQCRTEGRIEAPGRRSDPGEKTARGAKKRHAESAGGPERAKPRHAYCKS